MTEVPIVAESAPFTPAQRAWLNGFFAGLLSADAPAPATVPAAAPAPEETFPWHDPTLALGERMKLAEGRPVERRMMAAMGQLDCGQCGYLCKTYSEAIASSAEKDLGRCVPGGKPTQKMLKLLVADAPPPSAPTAPAPRAAVPSAPAPAAAAASRDRPVRARLLRSEPLNRPGAEKQTQNVVLSLAGTGLDYAPGDSLGVWPVNNGEEVELLLAILRAKGSEEVALASGERLGARPALLARCNLREPSEELLMLLSRHARDDIEATRLARMAEDDSALAAAAVHDVLDLLREFRSARPPVADFVASLAPLQPRLYSIASSLKCHPGEVHLTVAVVRYDLHERGYQGVASCFFAERLRRGARVPVYMQRAHGFALPADPATPIIMVGPGSGIAPFRAFVQERAVEGARGRNWLFFGNQHRELDFLYRSELEGSVKRGVLTRLDTAFSRDQEHKVYVQHRMREQGAELWRWLEEGAHFYVCGDAKRMAKDMDDALRSIVAEHGARSAENAAEYVSGLAAAGRYCRDVY